MTVLTPPFTVAALVLCVAGLAKLRSPRAAADALSALGLRGRTPLVRAFAGLEITVGVTGLVHPARPAAVIVACLYGAFTVLSLRLARRRASCGCFGESDAPASPIQSLLSLILALVALAAAVWTPHGLSWILSQPVGQAGVLLTGVAGAAYAIVIAYTDLPAAWLAWSLR